MIRLLVVEDDRNLRRLMKTVLTQSGYEVVLAENGKEALSALEEHHIDLLVCDIMMPQMDGYELARALRDAGYNHPVLMVTAKESIEDKRQGFSLGADDYMVKPIDMDEMLMRVSALLRRAHIHAENKITAGDTILDSDTLTVSNGSAVVSLPPKEFYLIFKLMGYPKQIFTRQQLMEEIWGPDAETDERTVDVHIKRLREKLADFPDIEIVTVRGLGYKAEKRA